jgi:hypothetical protein
MRTFRPSNAGALIRYKIMLTLMFPALLASAQGGERPEAKFFAITTVGQLAERWDRLSLDEQYYVVGYVAGARDSYAQYVSDKYGKEPSSCVRNQSKDALLRQMIQWAKRYSPQSEVGVADSLASKLYTACVLGW